MLPRLHCAPLVFAVKSCSSYCYIHYWQHYYYYQYCDALYTFNISRIIIIDSIVMYFTVTIVIVTVIIIILVVI
jgi:hypothetical protein